MVDEPITDATSTSCLNARSVAVPFVILLVCYMMRFVSIFRVCFVFLLRWSGGAKFVTVNKVPNCSAIWHEY